MRLICPSCGAVASADAWQNDFDVREVIAAIVKLPSPVDAKCLSYLALFRPDGNRGLNWARAKRVITALSDLVGKPSIQWDGRPARRNDAKFWADAIGALVDRPPKKLPLKSHGYLTAMVYELADAADRAHEKARNAAERSGNYRADDSNRLREPARVMTVDEMRAIRERQMGKAQEKKDDR